MDTIKSLYEVAAKSPYALWIGAGVGFVLGLIVG
jgi:hypothetical protein